MTKLLLLAALGTVLSIHVAARSVPTVKDYLQLRNQTFQTENESSFGSAQKLDDPREIKVNNILMTYKSREYVEGLDSNGAHFAAAGHFLYTKPLIEASNVFKIIQLLPKGASLHVHLGIASPVEWIVRNLTYMDNLYTCVDGKGGLRFRFFKTVPKEECIPGKNWRLVAEMRASASSTDFIDTWFAQSMSMSTPQHSDYSNANQAWDAFEAKISTISGIVNQEPALKKHFYKNLQEHYDDNVMYVETRSTLANVYSRDETMLKPIEILKLLREVSQKFKEDHPEFWGVRVIYAPRRFISKDEISKVINEAVEMKSKFPDFFAGFDLVGHEDRGPPLLNFLPELLKAADKGIKFFFHAGETAWHGTRVDENLFDAILLNATRIGHAYALASHPYLAEEVQRRKLYVESCPISNQVLKFIDDFRNHPAIPVLKEGFPLVIGSDGPGMWGASALSHDWYIAFVGMAGAHADLRFLKQLALNSIDASAMNPSEKATAHENWNGMWSEFLNTVIEIYAAENVQLQTVQAKSGNIDGRSEL